MAPMVPPLYAIIRPHLVQCARPDLDIGGRGTPDAGRRLPSSHCPGAPIQGRLQRRPRRACVAANCRMQFGKKPENVPSAPSSVMDPLSPVHSPNRGSSIRRALTTATCFRFPPPGQRPSIPTPCSLANRVYCRGGTFQNDPVSEHTSAPAAAAMRRLASPRRRRCATTTAIAASSTSGKTMARSDPRHP